MQGDECLNHLSLISRQFNPKEAWIRLQTVESFPEVKLFPIFQPRPGLALFKVLRSR